MGRTDVDVERQNATAMMHELLPWMLAIGKYILASAVLLVFYRIFLRKHASFRESRLFLLSVAFLALAVSQFRIEVTHPAPTIVEVEREVPAAQQVSLLPTADGLSVPLQGEPAVKPEPSLFQQVATWIRSHLLQLLLSLYMLVALTLVINLLLQYRSIRKLRRTGMGSRQDGYTLVEHPEVSTPFSFATTIFLPANLNANQRDIVETHELWHIRHKHYVDVLVQEITCCLFWFNPVQWLLRKDLRSVHEYQADRSVLNEGCDVYRYQTIILEEVLGHHFRLANGFNQSFTKKRFIQMKQFEPLRLNTLRKIASVCFLVLLFAALSVVPGKSQVIRVERSSTTSRTDNGTTTSVTFSSVDTVTNSNLSLQGNLSSAISFDPTASPKQLQLAYSKSLDTIQWMINDALPIASKLARSSHPADDVNNIDALLTALNFRANNQGIKYANFSEETKKGLTKQAFQDFEKTLKNMNDSIRLYRTYKVNGVNSPYLMKPATLQLMFMSDNLMKLLIKEAMTQAIAMMGSSMKEMVGSMSSMGNQMESSFDGADDSGEMNEAVGDMTKAMSEMMNSMIGSISTQAGNPAQTSNSVQPSVDRTNNPRQSPNLPSTKVNTTKVNTTKVSTTKVGSNIVDQNTLAYVARNDNDRDVRVEAIIRLTDQNTLAYVARNDREPFVRKMAIQRLTDRNTLAYVARNDFDRDVRVEAIIRLTDQNTLAYVARNDREPFVRKMAIQRLTDRNTLAYVARNDNDKDVRIEAIARMEKLDNKSNRR